MLDVIVALIPALAVATYIFGVRALALALVCCAACVIFEWGYRFLLKKPDSVLDLSAVVTGLLLSYCLPVTVPLWAAVIGSGFAIIVVKQLFGGIGKNIMNPALAGRAFMFSWPVIMTHWVGPRAYSNFFDFSLADAVTGATPLAALFNGNLPEMTLLEKLVGQSGGSMGEISTFALLLGGIYLIWRGIISWRIPVIYTATVFIVAFLFPVGEIARFDWALWNICSGGLALGAIFMATDYTTSPVTSRGQVIYAVGCGLLTLFIRYFGSYPEGVSYAILVMNACTWLLDKAGKRKVYGEAH
jgi:electron transport complex protein RnfD